MHSLHNLEISESPILAVCGMRTHNIQVVETLVKVTPVSDCDIIYIMKQSDFSKKLGRFVLWGLVPKILVAIHVAILIWVFVGTVVIFFGRNYIAIHLILISVVIILGLFLGYCPLTRLEEVLRRRKDAKFTFNNSFMTHYVNKALGSHFSVAQIDGVQYFVFGFSYFAAIFLYFIR